MHLSAAPASIKRTSCEWAFTWKLHSLLFISMYLMNMYVREGDKHSFIISGRTNHVAVDTFEKQKYVFHGFLDCYFQQIL